ncbi:MAG TPA: M56 family metallopeptidase [Thermoanaerobaculia bacterium]|jgi:beta-lactamase regulating signal transducer with metallopeptidase domain
MTAMLVVKSTLVFVSALALLRATRRSSAALRHRIASVTFAVALLLPLAASFAPARAVTVPAAAARVIAAAPAAQPQAAPSPRAAAAATPAQTRIEPRTIVAAVYLGGVALLLLSLAGGVFRLYRLRHRAEPSVSATRLANELARAEGLPSGIAVFVSEQLAVPMTFNRSILLPAETRDWEAAAVTRALRHELEHIVRRDWLAQIVSRIGCALYWPHPLVWMLWSRLRLEAERACDDAVLRGGAPEETYAEQLVELARRVAGHGAVPALSMATRSNLGSRVEAILDRSLRRSRIGRWTSLAVATLAAAILLGIAPLRLVAAPLAALHDPIVAHDDDRDDDHDDDSEDRDAESRPLDFALLGVARAGDTAALRSLLTRGADPNAAFDGDGNALIAAARGGHVEALAVLLAAGADPNAGVEGDGNALIAAASHGHAEAVQYLLDHGADIDRGVPGDANALIAAAGAGELEIVKLLIARGASIEEVVPGDENALIHACEGGSVAVARYLIEHGADVNARVWADTPQGGEWRTPLSMARRSRNAAELVRLLEAAGARQ